MINGTSKIAVLNLNGSGKEQDRRKNLSSFIDHSLEHHYRFIEHSQLVSHSILSAVESIDVPAEIVIEHDIPATVFNTGGAFFLANRTVYSS